MSTPAQPHKESGYAMSQVEVARALGCSKANVYKTELRALKKARDILARHGFKPSDLFDSRLG